MAQLQRRRSEAEAGGPAGLGWVRAEAQEEWQALSEISIPWGGGLAWGWEVGKVRVEIAYSQSWGWEGGSVGQR